MDPNVYAPPPPLNPKKPGLFSPKMLLVGAGGLVAILLSVILLAASGGGDTKTLVAQAVARQTTMVQVVEDASDNIAHPDLRKFNADALLFMKSDLQSLSANMAAYGVEKIPEDIAAAEADPGVTDQFDQAILESRFDSTYAGILEQKMSSQQALLQELYQKTDNETTQSNADTAYKNLQSLQESLEKIRF